MAAAPCGVRAPPAPLLSARTGPDSLFGRGIVDPGGRAIGRLSDIVVDFTTGRIAYAVIELDPRRHPNRLVVAPWNALIADTDAGRLSISLIAERVERAPAVQRGHAADRFACHWAALIDVYFGTTSPQEPPRSTQSC